MSTPYSCNHRQKGFSLLELMTAVAIFIFISGAAFGLLNVAQKRYQTEEQVLSSFQSGRLALDQIVRDVNGAGFPPLNQFSAVVPATNYAVSPIAWSPTYNAATATTLCTIGTCTTPGNFDLILEEYTTPANSVQWIRYQLLGTTLYRGTMAKATGTDPSAQMNIANGVMFPYATNVMNNGSAAQIGQINALHPGTFPGGNPVPVFTYTCDTATVPTLCTAAGAYNAPNNVRDVEVTLIIMTQNTDMQTNQLRVVTLNGRGHRVNPNQ